MYDRADRASREAEMVGTYSTYDRPAEVLAADRDRVVQEDHKGNLALRRSSCKKDPADVPDIHTAYWLGRSKGTQHRLAVPQAIQKTNLPKGS